MGRIAPPRNPTALAREIIEVASNRASYERPRAEIARLFSIDSTIEAYEQVYRGEA
jgi:hypothetical protein